METQFNGVMFSELVLVALAGIVGVVGVIAIVYKAKFNGEANANGIRLGVDPPTEHRNRPAPVHSRRRHNKPGEAVDQDFLFSSNGPIDSR